MKTLLSLLLACALTHCARDQQKPRLGWHCSVSPTVSTQDGKSFYGAQMRCVQDASPRPLTGEK